MYMNEYTERMFASNLSHRDRKPKYRSKFWTKHSDDGKRWPLTPFPFLAPWPSRPPAIETPPRTVPAGALISWPKNALCSRIPPEQAAPLSRRDDERWHTIGSHSALALRLYLAACNPSSSYVSVLLCFIKPILGNRYVRCRGFIVSEPRETHPQSEIADVPTYPVPPMITWGVWNLDPHPPP